MVGAYLERIKMFKETFLDSPLFGKSLHLTDEGEEILKTLVDKAPVRVFQVFNKKLNEKCLCSHIAQCMPEIKP